MCCQTPPPDALQLQKWIDTSAFVLLFTKNDRETTTYLIVNEDEIAKMTSNDDSLRLLYKGMISDRLTVGRKVSYAWCNNVSDDYIVNFLDLGHVMLDIHWELHDNVENGRVYQMDMADLIKIEVMDFKGNVEVVF
jgi:hypothetical protein